MVTIRLRSLSLYIASAAIICGLLISRPAFQSQWSPERVLSALLADVSLLLLLGSSLSLLLTLALPAGHQSRILRGAHLLLTGLIVTLCIISQVLFIKTGEILNVDILLFSVRHAHELSAIAVHAVDTNTLVTMLASAGLYFLALLSFKRPLLRHIQRVTLVLPFLFLPLGFMFAPELDKVQVFDFDPMEDLRLYRGEYKDYQRRQLEWNRSDSPDWRRGLLTGLTFGSRLSVSEFNLLSAQAGSDRIYSSPQFISVKKSPPNIVFILLESVRHDVVGAYLPMKSRDQNSPTPFLDKLAARSTLVEQAYTTIPHTSKALVGIYCGMFARFDTEITEGIPGNLPFRCLPHLLSAAGYQSAHFQTAPASFEQREVFLENVGFDHWVTQEFFAGQGLENYGYLGLDDREMIKPAINWMSQQSRRRQPFFAALLTVMTHHPYVSPGSVEPISDHASAKRAYLRALTYTDDVIRELFDEMQRKGLLENTIVIITGDHGEAFGEHGQIAHNGVSYEEGIRVPLLIHGPGIVPERRIIRGLRQHLDIMPTVLNLAGISHTGALPGRDIFKSAGHSHIITSCFYNYYCLSSISSLDQKLSYFFGQRNPELYNLAEDPWETRNLYSPRTRLASDELLLLAIRQRNSFSDAYKSRMDLLPPSPTIKTKIRIETPSARRQ